MWRMNKIKIKYDDIDETKPRWKVGDVIYSADSRGSGLYLVAELDDLAGDDDDD